MEKNTQHDPLDEYVRNTFDDHEENPASDMWSRIEGELPAALPAWRVFFLRNQLQLAAACILLLLSGLVCEHFYYENKLKALVGERAQPHPQPLPPGGGGLDSGKGNPFDPKYEVTTTKRELTATLDYAPLPPGGGAGGGAASHALSQLVPIQNHPVPPNLTPLSPVEGNGDGVAHTENPPASSTTQKSLSQMSNLPALLYQAPLSPGKEAEGGGVAVELPPIKPAHTLSGWYVGLHTMPHRTFESVTTTAQRPGMRPVFVSRSERPDVATDWWLRVGKTTGRRFGVESGIGFAESTRTTAHTARFRFADGAIHPGGSVPGQRRNFTYDLSTYGGSASVSLRMESADDSVPVADAEPVIVKISTTEQARLLRIPLLLSYRLGAGRVLAVAKVGLTGNFFLKNETVISARASQNNRLRFAQNNDTFVFERTDNFFLGYWASAGVEFRWNRRFSIVAEPAVSGNFARQDAQGHRLPDHLLAGVNVGVNWRL